MKFSRQLLVLGTVGLTRRYGLFWRRWSFVFWTLLFSAAVHNHDSCGAFGGSPSFSDPERTIGLIPLVLLVWRLGGCFCPPDPQILPFTSVDIAPTLGVKCMANLHHQKLL